MKVTPRVLAVGATCLVLGGLAMGAGPRVTMASTATRATAINPFAPKAPSAAPTVMPGENDPPGRAVRKNRPLVRPPYRPPVRSPFRPAPRR